MTFIIGSVERLEKEMQVLADQIALIQSKCSHPKEAVEKKHGSNAGNYDPSADCYWIDYSCHLCKKKWTEMTDKNGKVLGPIL